ncbi:MAG: aldehyde dehydrogenase family protein, partial [Pseudomonadales bacterium]|nr:aldehyde dehydrogenase family protein [Pseudomonadales bacterium]
MNAQQPISSPGSTIAYNPATGEEIGQVENTDMAKVPQMFEQARSAQKTWEAKSFDQRAAAVKKMRSYIVNHAENLSEVISQSNGKTRIDAMGTEVLPCTLACDWYAKNAEKVLKEKKIPVDSLLFFNKKSVLQHKALGVVGIISPWNYPLSIPFGEIIMGLMAGNCLLYTSDAADEL